MGSMRRRRNVEYIMIILSMFFFFFVLAGAGSVGALDVALSDQGTGVRDKTSWVLLGHGGLAVADCMNFDGGGVALPFEPSSTMLCSLSPYIWLT